MTFSKEYKKIILNIAEKTLNRKRKCTYSLSYYLNMFLYLDDDIVKWNTLKDLACYKPKKEGLDSNKNFHWRSIQNEFNRWTKLNIFVEAHNKFLKKYYYIMKPHLKSEGINLYIDTSYIWNKYGVEDVAYHSEYTKKKASKIATIVDTDGDIISLTYFTANQSVDKINDFDFIKKTFSHDVTIIQDLFDKIIVDLYKRKKINCGGDKAFATNNPIYYNSKRVNMIVPKKKRSKKQTNKMIKKIKQNIILVGIKLKYSKPNSKRNTNYKMKILSLENEIKDLKQTYSNNTQDYCKNNIMLKRRNVVEDSYKNLKKSERIVIRKERKIANYMSFLYLVELKRITNKYYNIIKTLDL